MVGGTIQAAKKTWKALGLAAVIAVLVGFQWLALQPGPQRTDWKSAAAQVRAQANPRDLVLVQVSIWRDVFRYNLAPSNFAIASAESVQTLAAQAGYFLEQCRQSEADRGLAVWAVVLQPYFDSGPNPEFEAALKDLGLEFTRTEFRGIEHILVYRVAHAGAAPIEWNRGNSGDSEETLNAISDLALELTDAKNYRIALKAFRWIFDVDPGARRVYGRLQLAIAEKTDIEPLTLAVRALLKGHRAMGQKDFAAAQDSFREAVQHDPKFAAAYSGLAILAPLVDHDESSMLEDLRTACALDPELRGGELGAFMERLAAGDYRACYDMVGEGQAPPEFRDWLRRRAEAAGTNGAAKDAK
jgi:tetratricopeptide (TPR) repeat protein